MPKPFYFVALAGGLLVSLSCGATPSGAMLGNTCAGCHGTNGVSVGSAPSLKGLPPDYIVTAMKAFRSGERPSTIMGRIAKGYNDEEIAAMAKFFGDMK